MKEYRIYVIDLNDVDENIGLQEVEQWSDEQVIAKSESQCLAYSLQGFASEWNCDNIVYPEFSYMRIIEVELPRKVIGYQVYEENEFPEDIPDWWVFGSRNDAELFAKWSEMKDYYIEEVKEGDIEEPEIITFDDYIYSQCIGGFNENSSYEDILLWLRDFGIPKTRGHNIAERILKAYKP